MSRSHDQVTIQAVGCPLLRGGRETRGVRWREGLTVRQATLEAFPGVRLGAWASGGLPVGGDAPAEMGETYLAWSAPGDVMFWVNVVLLTVSIASAGFAIYSAIKSNREAKKLKKALRNSDYSKEVEDVSDSNYGWNYDAANTAAQGAPLPVLYGERLVIPPLIQVHRRAVGSNQEYLEAVAGVCQGGAGLADRVAVLPDERGELDIRLDHSSWRNYILLEQYAADDSETTDRLSTATGVLSSVYWDPTSNTLKAASNCDNLHLLFDYSNLTTRPTASEGTFLYDDTGSAYGRYTVPASAGLSGNGSKYNYSVFITLDTPTRVREVDLLMTGDSRWTFDVYGGSADEGTDIRQYKPLAQGVCTESAPPGVDPRLRYWTAQAPSNKTYLTHLLITMFRGAGTKPVLYKVRAYGSVNQSSGTDITQYAEVEYREGLPVQQPLALCTGVWSALNVSRNLSIDWFVFSSSKGASPEKLEVNLQFPYGLYDASGTEMRPYTVTLAVERRWVDADGSAGEWRGFAGASTRLVTAQSPSAYGVSYTEDLTEIHDHWEVRMKYSTPLSASPSIVGDCVWDTLVEGYDFAPSYPGTCVAGVRLLATDALSGTVPQIKVRASRPLVCVWDGSRWLARPASNPAWAAYDIICQPHFPADGFDWQADAEGLMHHDETRDEVDVASLASDAAGTLVTTAAAHGLSEGDLVALANAPGIGPEPREVLSVLSATSFVVGDAHGPGSVSGCTAARVDRTYCSLGVGDAGCAVSPLDMDYRSFAAWAERCDEDGIRMAGYFDGSSSGADALSYVCDVGRGAIVRRGQVYAAMYDGLPDETDALGNPIPCFTFDDDNIVEGTFRVSYLSRESTPSEAQIFYYDRERENSRAAVIRYAKEEERYRNAQDVTLYCCVDRSVAEDYGDYLLSMGKVRRAFAWTGDSSSMPLDIGDLVSVKGFVARVTAASLDSQMRRQFEATEYVITRFVDEYHYVFTLRQTGGGTFYACTVNFSGAPWPSDDPRTVMAAWAGRTVPFERVDGEPGTAGDLWVDVRDPEGDVPDRLLPSVAYRVTYPYLFGLTIAAKGYCRRPSR